MDTFRLMLGTWSYLKEENRGKLVRHDSMENLCKLFQNMVEWK